MGTKISALTADTTPTSDDYLDVVDAGTGTNKKVTATNLIKKAHGLGDGLVKIENGIMVLAVAGVDYEVPA
jgi:hypothetical protein